MTARPLVVLRWLALSGGACAVLGAPLAATAGSVSDADGPTVAVRGTLLQTSVEPDSGRAEPTYALRLGNGDLVSLRAGFGDVPPPNARFAGELTIPAPVQDALADRGVDLDEDTVLGQTTAAGRAALRLVDASSATMSVAESQVRPAAAVVASGTTKHRLRVAVPVNLGTSTSTDASVLQALAKVADYWDDESDGAVDVVVPTQVRHYASLVSGAPGTCGLKGGSVFNDMAQEAESLFPDLAPTDQVVVLAPETGCSGSLGIGYVGEGFAATDGALVATADPAFIVGTVAHEMGHNYGLGHANLGTSTADARPYLGIYDVMGYGLAGVNQLPTLSTGFRAADAITVPGEVDTLTAAGGTSLTRTIAARQDESGLRSLAVTDPGSGVVYDVDYRSGSGQDEGTAYDQAISAYGYSYRSGVVVTRSYRDATSGGQGVIVVPNGARTSTRAGETWTSPSGRLTVRVDATTDAEATVTVSSAAASPVEIPAAPAPSIAGPARVGTTLSATPGPWTAGSALTYRWLVDGAAVATGPGYTPTAAQLGRSLRLEVTGSLAGFTTTVRSSAPVTVAPGVLTSAAPRISGSARPGGTLAVVRGTWSRNAALSQVWYVDGKAATSAPSLRLSKAMRGRSVVVKVTGRAAGYTSVVRSSAAVRVSR